MTEKRFVLVKCVEHYWGIVDKSLENIDQLVLMHMNKTSVSYIVNVLNQLTEENEQLKSTNMEMEDYLGRLEEENINIQIKLQKIRDYAKEDGEVKQGIIEKVILE